jgi:hypothetical protein
VKGNKKQKERKKENEMRKGGESEGKKRLNNRIFSLVEPCHGF